MKKISIIIPAYNEEDSLPYLYERLTKLIDDIKNYEFEILFVNDGSKDKTLEIIKEYRKKDNRFAYVNLSRNFGKEIAMIAGLDYAKGDAVVFMDADLQDPPELLPELIKYWEEGYDDVYARRKTRDGETFLKKFTSVAAITFSTASSNASVPASMEILEELGVGKTTRSFTIPMGATINMDGTAIMQGVAALFIVQIYGIDLSINQMITIILTATLASIGTAGVPGVGMIMLSMVLTSVNLPLEGIGLIMGVERIIDMFRTTVNVMGDNICTLIIANSENDFDKDMFYGEKEEQLA